MTVKSIHWGDVFASAQVALTFVAAVCYAISHDWKKAVYWILVSAVTAVVVWWF